MPQKKRLTYLKEEFAEVYSKIFKGATESEIIETLDDPRVQDLMDELQKETTDLGAKFQKNSSEAESKAAGKEGVGMGAFSNALTTDASKFLIRHYIMSYVRWVAIIITAYLLLIFFFALALKLIANFLVTDLPKMRDSAPEAYCAFVYRLNDTHTYAWCDEKYGLEDQANKSD